MPKKSFGVDKDSKRIIAADESFVRVLPPLSRRRRMCCIEFCFSETLLLP